MDQNKDSPAPILGYATPQRPLKRIHPVIRVLVGILALVFVLPTIDIVIGALTSEGPVSEAIGIVVTLSIAVYLAFISATGRFRFRRQSEKLRKVQ